MPRNVPFRLNDEDENRWEISLFTSQLDEICDLFGARTYYIKQEQKNFDEIFGESSNKALKDATEIHLWCDQFDEDFDNEDTALHSKFGFSLNITEATFYASSNYFNEHGITPRESDLIFYKKANKLFEISKITPQDGFKIRLDCDLYTYDNIDVDESSVFEPEILNLEDINDIEVTKIIEPVQQQVADEGTEGTRKNRLF